MSSTPPADEFKGCTDTEGLKKGGMEEQRRANGFRRDLENASGRSPNQPGEGTKTALAQEVRTTGRGAHQKGEGGGFWDSVSTVGK